MVELSKLAIEMQKELFPFCSVSCAKIFIFQTLGPYFPSSIKCGDRTIQNYGHDMYISGYM
jgi:hypothetical protein